MTKIARGSIFSSPTPRGFPELDIAPIREAIMIAADLVTPTNIPSVACRDLNDLPVLGTAVAGQVDVLITVDEDLLPPQSFRRIPIIRPGEFWKLLGGFAEVLSAGGVDPIPRP